MNAKQLSDQLNDAVRDLNGIFEEFGMPRVQAVHVIGQARANGKDVTAPALNVLGWTDTVKLAKALTVVADKLDSLEGMPRARAIKLINGGIRRFDLATNEEVGTEGKPNMPPNEITETMIQEWLDAKEAAA